MKGVTQVDHHHEQKDGLNVTRLAHCAARANETPPAQYPVTG